MGSPVISVHAPPPSAEIEIVFASRHSATMISRSPSAKPAGADTTIELGAPVAALLAPAALKTGAAIS
jgi:hypothetical protein